MFQSTHPYRVRQSAEELAAKVSMFQSTHPYRVRQSRLLVNCGKLIVSIHAPIQGATLRKPRKICVSNSFNPRTHTGCDVLMLLIIRLLRSFNPRTHTGCDSITSVARAETVFQSTHPYRVRPDIRRIWEVRGWFQSTHPYRVRLLPRFPCERVAEVSIHAPIQGATMTRFIFTVIRNCFNPRTHTGCDLML